jgi:hypothetical protein
MKLFTDEQRAQMLTHGRLNAECVAKDGHTIDFKPVVKLFVPWGAGTWLLTELDPENPDIAFGLCDLGMGCPELGNVSIAEIESIRGPGGLGIERDIHFSATKTLSGYAEEAARLQHISA